MMFFSFTSLRIDTTKLRLKNENAKQKVNFFSTVVVDNFVRGEKQVN
jgi:hypothetical protein